ncbi:hypothetical protein ACTWPT_02245 [Nonomuraea sp. 3N208]|uniref:hypothetical protein n=1 Tax=Nonomuraea sp. 3N208 TaxID=3457421 RepID=UPI003FCE6DD1
MLAGQAARRGQGDGGVRLDKLRQADETYGKGRGPLVAQVNGLVTECPVGEGMPTGSSIPIDRVGNRSISGEVTPSPV